MSSPEIWEVGKNLPPGLLLPPADVPTDQYLTANFMRQERDCRDVRSYGLLVVALAAFTAKKSGRVSMMPTTKDIDQMYDAGYGLSLTTLRTNHGGLGKLQQSLRFFNRDYVPSADEALERYQWVADYGYDLDPLPEPLTSIEQILTWGAARHLTPSRDNTYKIFQGDTTPLRRMFGIEKRDKHRRISRLDVLKFGSEVLETFGHPVDAEVLNTRYPDRFIGNPQNTIKLIFGTMTKFWQEFGRLPRNAQGLTSQDMVNLGVRRAIAMGEVDITTVSLAQLTKDKIFPSHELCATLCGSIPEYRQQVQEAYDTYLVLQAEFSGHGVDAATMQVVCRNFEANAECVIWLRQNLGVIKKLSADWYSADYVRGIMQTGFDLSDPPLMEKQFNEAIQCLQRLSVIDEAGLRFVFSIIPRFGVDEAFRRLRNAPPATVHKRV